MKLLITGASGLYGSALLKITPKDFKIYSAYNKDRPIRGNPIHFDISNKTQTEHAIKEVEPDVVVHAAALTDVDKCEKNRELAWKINVEGTRNIVDASKECQAFLVYISTDYVFNGTKGDYSETDDPDPINYYGFTKLKAEELIEKEMEEYCIGRTSVIYGVSPAAGKTNFALWVLNNLRQRKPVKIIMDQWNSPTLNTNLAEMTIEILKRRMTGIYHLSGATRINRYDFAKTLASNFNLDSNFIVPSALSDFKWAAKRPKDSSLNVNRAQRRLREKPLPIKKAISKLVKEYREQAKQEQCQNATT